MKTKSILRTIGKCIITGSTMVAMNEVISYHANPYKGATSTRFSCNIAGYSIGFVLGRFISDEVVDFIEDIVSEIGLYLEDN